MRVVVARRGPLPALRQVGGVRRVARGRGLGRAPAQPLGRDPVDGRRRDDHRARRRPQLVRRRRSRATSTPDAPGRHDRRRGDASPTGRSPPGADTTVSFSVSNSYTNATLPGATGNDSQSTTRDVTITTTLHAPAARAPRRCRCRSCPRPSIPAAASAPALDGAEGAGEYAGEALDVGRKWEPGGEHPQLRPPGRRLRLLVGAGHRRQHLRQGHPQRRRPVLPGPRQGRLPGATR